MNNVLIFRITEKHVCVDGLIFVKSRLGIYRAEKEEFNSLHLYKNLLDSFLESEKIEEEGILKLNFDNYFSETLSSLKIKTSLN